MTQSSLTRGRISVTIAKKKRKNCVSYSLRWFDPASGKRRSVFCGHNLHEAKLARTAKERELNGTAYEQKTLYSFNEFEEDFRQSQGNRLKADTVKSYFWALDSFRKRFPDKRYLQDVTTFDVQQFISWRKKTARNSSVNSQIRSLRALFNYAVEWERLTKNPFVKPKKLPEPSPEINTITRDEENRILRAIEVYKYPGVPREDKEKVKLKYKATVKLATQGGLRSGEIRNLRWKDMDLDTGEINLVCREEWATKSWKNRTVFVKDHALFILRRLKMLTGGSFEDMPFHYYDSTGAAAVFKRISERTGVRFTLHDLRRTCSSRMAEVVTPQVHQIYMGHASIETTMKYYTSIPKESLKQAMEKTNPDSQKSQAKIVKFSG